MKAIVLSGGPLADVSAEDIPEADIVIAADSGLRHAKALGLKVDLVIGDMDSVSQDLLNAATDSVIEVDPNPNASDLELAIDAAVNRGATDVTIVDGGTGRFDHVLGNVFVLTRPELAHIRMSAIVGKARVYVARGEFEMSGIPGHIFSQYAVNGPVTGITIEGTDWAGYYERLESGSTLCLHDVFTEEPAKFTFETGTLLFIVPGE